MGLLCCLGGILCHVYHKFSDLSLEKVENEETIDSTPFDKGHGEIDRVLRSGQRIPLLDYNNSESDEDSQTENPNSSEVLFDILKRRDSSRR